MTGFLHLQSKFACGATQRRNRYDAISGLETNANKVKTVIDSSKVSIDQGVF